MAATRGKKMTAAVDFPTCPVCQRGMSPPIYMCQTGHSLCGACAGALRPPLCPVCHQPMTQMRNRSLEDLINKAKVPCPHRAAGCPLSPEHASVSEHEQECYFRTVACPLAAGLGKCSWTGAFNQIADHVKEKHPSMFTDGLEAEIELDGITLRECDRRVHFAAHQRNLFIITFKIDSIQRMAYWTIQVLGPKKQAHQYYYDIHVSSKREPQRKVVFTERCSSDTLRADDIFNQCFCAVLSLNSLTNFIIDDKLSYRFIIRKNYPKYKPRRESGEATNDNPRSPGSDNGFNGPGKNEWSRTSGWSRSPGPGQKGPGRSSDTGA